MPTIDLFNAALAPGFAASEPFEIVGEAVSLDFEVAVTALATVQFYLEQTGEDPRAAGSRWFRELSEEVSPGGAVDMAIVVRTLRANGGAALGVGTHRLSAQFVRRHKFARVQIAASAGTATARIWAPFGIIAQT